MVKIVGEKKAQEKNGEERKEEKKVEVKKSEAKKSETPQEPQKIIKSVTSKETLTIRKTPELEAEKVTPLVTRRPRVRTVTTVLEPTPMAEVKTTLPKWRNRNVSESIMESACQEIEELTKVEPPSILSNNRSLHMERMVTVTEWER
jgi:hypothetical protein